MTYARPSSGSASMQSRRLCSASLARRARSFTDAARFDCIRVCRARYSARSRLIFNGFFFPASDRPSWSRPLWPAAWYDDSGTAEDDEEDEEEEDEEEDEPASDPARSSYSPKTTTRGPRPRVESGAESPPAAAPALTSHRVTFCFVPVVAFAVEAGHGRTRTDGRLEAWNCRPSFGPDTDAVGGARVGPTFISPSVWREMGMLWTSWFVSFGCANRGG